MTSGLVALRTRAEERWATHRLWAAACRALTGGSPTGAAPHAGQLARNRRPMAQAATTSPMSAPASSDRAVLRAGHPLAAQDHRQGRAQGRVADAMARAPPWTLIFPGKTSAPIRRTGEESDPGNQAGRSYVQAHMKQVCCIIGAAAISILILSSCSGQPGPHQTVTGMLVRVGGPVTLAAPPKPVPLPGEVVARNAMGRQFTAAIGKSGRFELSLPVGTYRLTGHGPQVSGETCSASRPLHVTMPKPLHNIRVVCSIS